MPTIVIQHQVRSFEAWKQAFDSDPVGRAQAGVTRHAVYRATDDPNAVLIHLDMASREQAERMLQHLRQLWTRVGDAIGFGPAGVQARILDQVERVEY